jgi:hypothetical protein
MTEWKFEPFASGLEDRECRKIRNPRLTTGQEQVPADGDFQSRIAAT